MTVKNGNNIKFVWEALPLMRKKKAPVSLATARAIKVFPVPGGPYNNIPRGGLIPIAYNQFNCSKNISFNLGTQQSCKLKVVP